LREEEPFSEAEGGGSNGGTGGGDSVFKRFGCEFKEF
jgi:hypothetical protein